MLAPIGYDRHDVFGFTPEPHSHRKLGIHVRQNEQLLLGFLLWGSLYIYHSCILAKTALRFSQITQDPDSPHIVCMLGPAWAENGPLTWKLLQQLRCGRRGKSARETFYLCLRWLLKNDPQKLLHIVERQPTQSYWQNLVFFVRFALGCNHKWARAKRVNRIKASARLAKALSDHTFSGLYNTAVHTFATGIFNINISVF